MIEASNEFINSHKIRWSFEYKDRKVFFKSLPQLLENEVIQDVIKNIRSMGGSYDIVCRYHRERTRKPQVLIIERYIMEDVTFIEEVQLRDNEDIFKDLHWVDSCGKRGVYFYNPVNDDYETAIDLPEKIYNKIEAIVKSIDPKIFVMRREDPGLGIHIPEIDEPGFSQ